MPEIPGLLAVVMIIGLPIGIFSLVVLVPICNKFFALIWEDPTERQRQVVIKRIKEHVLDDVPEQTAVMMTAAEMNTTEANLLKAAELFSAADAKAIITGKRGIAGIMIGKMAKHMRAGAAGPKRKPRRIRPQSDETDTGVEDGIRAQEENDL